MVGFCLRKHITKRLIAFVSAEVFEENGHFGMGRLLSVFWEIRKYEHLVMPRRCRKGTMPRLSKVWSKLLVWSKLAGEFEVVRLLDADLLIRASMDGVFTQLQGANIAGVFRGVGEFDLRRPRPARSIAAPGKGYKRGGINGGVIYLKPNQTLFETMVVCLRDTYFAPAVAPPNSTGGEQDVISYFFGSYVGGNHCAIGPHVQYAATPSVYNC